MVSFTTGVLIASLAVKFNVTVFPVVARLIFVALLEAIVTLVNVGFDFTNVTLEAFVVDVTEVPKLPVVSIKLEIINVIAPVISLAWSI